MPRLENWKIVYKPASLGVEKAFYLVGEIYNDEKGRFVDGKWVRTSLVERMDTEKGYARTMNTKYELGKESK